MLTQIEVFVKLILSFSQVTAGLLEYFNVMLGSQLLYKFEREQFADISKELPDKQVSVLTNIHTMVGP